MTIATMGRWMKNADMASRPLPVPGAARRLPAGRLRGCGVHLARRRAPSARPPTTIALARAARPWSTSAHAAGARARPRPGAAHLVVGADDRHLSSVPCSSSSALSGTTQRPRPASACADADARVLAGAQAARRGWETAPAAGWCRCSDRSGDWPRRSRRGGGTRCRRPAPARAPGSAPSAVLPGVRARELAPGPGEIALGQLLQA